MHSFYLIFNWSTQSGLFFLLPIRSASKIRTDPSDSLRCSINNCNITVNGRIYTVFRCNPGRWLTGVFSPYFSPYSHRIPIVYGPYWCRMFRPGTDLPFTIQLVCLMLQKAVSLDFSSNKVNFIVYCSSFSLLLFILFNQSNWISQACFSFSSASIKSHLIIPCLLIRFSCNLNYVYYWTNMSIWVVNSH